MPIAALFTTAKAWKQPTYLWMDRENVVGIYVGILFGHKKEILPLATTLRILCLVKQVIQKEINVWYHSHVESEKKKKKRTQTLGYRGQLVVARGGEWAVNKMGEGSQKARTSGYKIHKYWDVTHSTVTTVNNGTFYIWMALTE